MTIKGKIVSQQRRVGLCQTSQPLYNPGAYTLYCKPLLGFFFTRLTSLLVLPIAAQVAGKAGSLSGF